MGVKKYFFILLLLLLNIFGLMYLTTIYQSFIVKELVFITLFSVFAIILLNGLNTNKDWTWLFASLLFMLALINTAYLVLNISSKLLLLLLFTNAMGFIISIGNLSSKHRKEEVDEDIEMFKEVLKRQDLLSQELPEEKEFLKPEIIIEDLKPAKKTPEPKPTQKKTTKKKVTKKKSKPKSTKKKTTKKTKAIKKAKTNKRSVKFIASETSARYHITKCVWTKKIKPSARIYYQSIEQAEKAGHLPCRCTA